jgi:hypothetical protein
LKAADPHARFEVDHILIVPRAFDPAAAAPEGKSNSVLPRAG